MTIMSAGRQVLRSLASNVREEMLRGVRLDRVLQSFGRHWSRQSGYTPEEEFSTSQPVETLNDFISHDWETGRWPKILNLYLVYNGRGAAAISGALITSMCIIYGGQKPASFFARCEHHLRIGGAEYDVVAVDFYFVSGNLVFVIILLGYQWIRQAICCCWPRQFAFVDKLCINQVDEALKAEGIGSLAGFLKRTDRLVLLWTPRYFTRLWCAYEVATWLRLKHNFDKSVRFVPLSYGSGLFGWMLGLVAFWSLLTYLCEQKVPRGTAVFMSAYFCSSLTIYSLRHHAKHLLHLPRHLRNFSIREAECFCCSVNHVHPDTGLPVPCDRELVYSRLVSWYKADRARDSVRTFVTSSNAARPNLFVSEGVSQISVRSNLMPDTASMGPLLSQPPRERSPEEWQEECLDSFDFEMQTVVMNAVCSRRTLIRVRYVDALIINVSCIFYLCDMYSAMVEVPLLHRIRIVVPYLSVYFLSFPVLFKLLVLVVARSVAMNANEKVPDFLWALALAGFFVAMVMAVHSFQLTSLQSESLTPQIANLIIQFLAGIRVYHWCGQCVQRDDELLQRDDEMTRMQTMAERRTARLTASMVTSQLSESARP